MKEYLSEFGSVIIVCMLGAGFIAYMFRLVNTISAAL